MENERTAEIAPTLLGNPPLTRRVAEVALQVSFEEIPDRVIERAKCCFLDWLGTAIAGSSSSAVRILREVTLRHSSSGPSGLLGRGAGKAGPVEAALINGLAGHEMDFDDCALAMHPSAVIMPGALAVAEERNASGKGFIEAIVAGQELGDRVERLVGYAHYVAGWHTTGTIGTFAATGATAKLMGLDLAGIETALGIAGTQAAGLRAVFGSMCKPLHAGKAASIGTQAALLAEAGFTSTREILEAEYGFVWTQSTKAIADALVELLGPEWLASVGPQGAEAAIRPLGDPYLADRIYPKLWASCGATHSPMGAVEELVRKYGITADQVESVLGLVAPFSLDHANIQMPTTGLEGKFSVRYAITASLLGYDTMGYAFTDEAVNRPEVKDLIKRVRVDYAPATTREAPSTVHVTLKDGRELVESYSHRDATIGWDRLSPKFELLTAPIIGKACSTELQDAISHLEDLDSLRSIHRILESSDLNA